MLWKQRPYRPMMPSTIAFLLILCWSGWRTVLTKSMSIQGLCCKSYQSCILPSWTFKLIYVDVSICLVVCSCLGLVLKHGRYLLSLLVSSLPIWSSSKPQTYRIVWDGVYSESTAPPLSFRLRQLACSSPWPVKLFLSHIRSSLY